MFIFHNTRIFIKQNFKLSLFPIFKLENSTAHINGRKGKTFIFHHIHHGVSKDAIENYAQGRSFSLENEGGLFHVEVFIYVEVRAKF